MSETASTSVTINMPLLNVSALMRQNRMDKCERELCEVATKYRLKITQLELEPLNA